MEPAGGLTVPGAHPGGMIGGRWVTTGPTMPTLDPAHGSELAEVAITEPAAVAEAVDAARVAWSSWRAESPSHRARILTGVADAIEGHAEQIARAITVEVGKPLRQSRGDVRSAAAHFRFFAGTVETYGGHEIPTAQHHESFTRLEPVGVTAHLTPWNSPFAIPARSVAAALAAGNPVVLKPSELAPLAGANLVACLMAAGVPTGVVGLVQGEAHVGRVLVGHRDVRSVTFTGSVAVGAELRRSTAERMTRLSLELGGKSPVVICDDADLDSAVVDVHSGLVRNAGQTCLCPARVLVHRDRHQEFVDRFAARLARTTIGDGLDDPEMGPMISNGRREAVECLVSDAQEYATAVHVGGRPALPAPLRRGYFLEPSLFVDVPRGSTLDQQEVFGPVLVVHPFSTLDEAVDLANDVDYGLAAGIWTQRLDTAFELTRRLEAGSVSVNEYPIRFPYGPHGGVKRSGIGREQGLEALRNYVEVKKVSFRFRGTV